MISRWSLKNFMLAIIFTSTMGCLVANTAAAAPTDPNQEKIIEETGVIYATDMGVIFDADSGVVYDLKGDGLLEHAGERAVITGSLTTGNEGESVLTIDTLEIEQLPVGSEEQPDAEELGTEQGTALDQGSEVEGSGLENPPLEAQPQN